MTRTPFRFTNGTKVRVDKQTEFRPREIIGRTGTIFDRYTSSNGTKWYQLRFEEMIRESMSYNEWVWEESVSLARPDPITSHSTWSTT